MSQSSLLEKCCLIGESVGGNPTHFMVEQAFAAAGIDWRFLTFEVSGSKLCDALRGVAALGFSGALLLPSLQRLSWEHVGKHTERAERSHSVSCLVRRDDRLVGDDLAGESMLACAMPAQSAAGRHALLLGLEGRGQAAAHAVLSHGAASLRIVDDSQESVDALIERLAALYPGRVIESLTLDDDIVDLPNPADLLLCASCWPKEQDAAVARSVAPALHPRMVVADARVRAGLTPLLHTAAERGARVVTGLEILVCEIAEAVLMWTGVDPPRDVLHDAGEEFLGV